MKIHKPYTREEINRMLAHCEERLEGTQKEYPDARPLPPLSEDECLKLFFGMLNDAAERALTPEECFLHGQLLAQYRQAIAGAVLDYKGRVYVITEEMLEKAKNNEEMI